MSQAQREHLSREVNMLQTEGGVSGGISVEVIVVPQEADAGRYEENEFVSYDMINFIQ